jgi:hypothetical protein
MTLVIAPQILENRDTLFRIMLQSAMALGRIAIAL